MTAALKGGEWSAARPGRNLPPGKTRYAFYRRLGRPQGRSGRSENLVPTGIRSRTVQPVAQSLYRLSYPAQNIHMYTHQNLRATDIGVQYKHFHTPELRTTYKDVKYAHVKGKVIPVQVCGTRGDNKCYTLLSFLKDKGRQYRVPREKWRFPCAVPFKAVFYKRC